jgi:hypothetical protein
MEKQKDAKKSADEEFAEVFKEENTANETMLEDEKLPETEVEAEEMLDIPVKGDETEGTKKEETIVSPETSPAEDWEQKYKSYKGIYDSELRKMQEKERQYLAEIEALKAEKGKKEPEQKVEEKPEEQSAEIQAFLNEYPEIAIPVQKIIQQEISKTVETILSNLDTRDNAIIDALKPIFSKYAEDMSNTHYQKIKETHPDFEELRDSGELLQWIESQPAYLKKSLMQVFESGETEEVIDLLNRYKETKKPVEQQEPQGSDIDINKLKAMEAIGKKPMPMPKKATAVSFEDAFAEASRT